MTWEPASTLPQVLIDEFESGTGLDEQMISDIRFGVVNHTLVMAPSGTKDAPPQKKRQRQKSRPLTPDTTTYIICIASKYFI